MRPMLNRKREKTPAQLPLLEMAVWHDPANDNAASLWRRLITRLRGLFPASASWEDRQW